MITETERSRHLQPKGSDQVNINGAVRTLKTFELIGLTSDIKPNNSNGGFSGLFIENGSTFSCLDGNMKTWVFDRSGDLWYEINL
jgi:hypothetical protein